MKISTSAFQIIIRSRILLSAILLLFLQPKPSASQTPGSIWYFGDHAALDFNSGSPVAISNSAMHAFECAASVCDNDGNLLFYAHGETIWDRNNLPMPNGTGLSGDTSSAQALIVRNPDSCNLYYVFTVGSHLTPNGGVWYSVVNMNLNGGYGDVVAGQKNIQLLSHSVEGIAGIRNANGHDVWVIFHKINSNVFDACSVTSAGITSMPVASSIGPFRDANSIIGQIKPSHSGTQIAMTITFTIPSIIVFDFDPATGIISNSNNISSAFTNVNGAYGIEFSPDDNLLYLTSIWGTDYLYQYDFTNGNVTTLDQASGNYVYGSLQLASDGKIYLARQGQSYLGVINDPNTAGTGCNYTANGVTLASGTYSMFGLTNEPNYIYNVPANDPCGLPSIPSIFVPNPEVCEKFCLDFFDTSAASITSWHWLFDGGVPNSSTDQNPTNICYPVPGTYDVTLITTSANGSDTTTLNDFITVNPTPPFPTITQTGNTLTSSAAASYQWQFNSADIPGATNQSYDATQTGYYTVIAGDSNGCVNSIAQYVLFTGISDVYADANISIYPNPSDGKILINWLNAPVENEFSIQIFNTVDQQVYFLFFKISNKNFNYEMDLSDLPPGIYTFRMTSGEVSFHQQLIIQK